MISRCAPPTLPVTHEEQVTYEAAGRKSPDWQASALHSDLVVDVVVVASPPFEAASLEPAGLRGAVMGTFGYADTDCSWPQSGYSERSARGKRYFSRNQY
jgi:hypothetical protein